MKKNLEEDNAELANEWHPTKNGQLTPDDVTPHSNKSVWWKGRCGHEWKAQVNSRNKGNGCPYCAGKIPIKGKNDLAFVNPKLATEWHPLRNNNLSPEDVTCGSNKKVWWKCHKGHEWQAIISNRSKGKGCPYCMGKIVIKGENDLVSVNPKLSAEWHPYRNGNLSPENFSCGSNKKIWWKCHKGHEWQATITNRSRGKGCPYCEGRYAIKGENDLAYLNPKLVAEWHPFRNGELIPEDFTCRSSKKVWWKCHKGHEWKACIKCRQNGSGCPYCSGRYGIRKK